MEAAAAAFADGDKGGGGYLGLHEKEAASPLFLGWGRNSAVCLFRGGEEIHNHSSNAAGQSNRAYTRESTVVASCESSGGDGLSDRDIQSPPSPLPFPT